MKRERVWPVVVGVAAAMVLAAAGGPRTLLAAQQSQSAQPAPAAPANRLVTGKLIYVEPMPSGLDRWLQQDLADWGRYKVTSNSEGVDLEIGAVIPERQPQYRQRNGVPLPKKERRDEPQETSIDVVDWVSGERLWSAALVDKKVEHDAAPPPPGPRLEIRVRGMSADQLALKITHELRRYVEQLETQASH